MDDPDFERAVERDLIGLGLRLRWLCDGSDRLNWRDLLTIVYTARQDSFLGRFELGDAAEWGVSDHLLAGIFDTLQGANWQRGGGRGPRPESLPRPVMGDGRSGRKRHSDVNSVDDMPMGANESGVFKGEPTPLNELMDWLGWK